MKYAYVTVLSSKNYLSGILTLNVSLKHVSSQYPLVVLTASDIDGDSIACLKEKNITVIATDTPMQIPQKIIQSNIQFGMPQWSRTFTKLLIFELIEYDKMVYLDSDMIVLENIDCLFQYNHMSAVVAGKLLHPEWEGFNSGCMVFIPHKGLSAEMLSLVNHFDKPLGDQDVLQEYYYDWKNHKELELPQGYNVFYKDIEFYVNKAQYALSNRKFKVIHYIGVRKPWMYSTQEVIRECLSCCLHLRWTTLRVFLIYLRYLKEWKREE